MCDTFSSAVGFQRDVPFLPRRLPRQARRRTPAPSHLWLGRTLLWAHPAYIIPLVFASPFLLSKTPVRAVAAEEGSLEVPGFKPPLSSPCLSLMKEVLQERRMVCTSFQALPRSCSRVLHLSLLFSVLSLLFCIQQTTLGFFF